MRLYVETNFLLELARRQPEAAECAKLIGRARAGELELLIPSISFAEASANMVQRWQRRNDITKRLNTEVDDLTRSNRPEDDGLKAASADLTASFIGSVEREQERFNRFRRRLNACGAVLSMDTLAAVHAAEVELPLEESVGGAKGYGRFDAAILGCVLSDLERRPSMEVAFATTDSKLRNIL